MYLVFGELKMSRYGVLMVKNEEPKQIDVFRD